MPHISSKHQDSFLALSREEEHIQRSLHELVDAQSEGLQVGFAGASDQDASSTGSRTPTSGSLSIPRRINTATTDSHITTPIRQPTRRKLGLYGARRGIIRAISNLAKLKAEQGNLLEEELVDKSSELSTVQTLAQKQTILEEQIRSIEESEESGHRISNMRREEHALDIEIKDMESRLWEMKARQRRLLGDIQELENRVQSQLSSYAAALELSRKEARDFLRSPRADVAGVGKRSRNDGLWSLPMERRTLPMAEEQFRDEQQALPELIQAAVFERKALEEGAVVWEDVVREVAKVESLLRVEMQRIGVPRRGFDGGSRSPSPANGMKSVQREMRRVMSRVESQLEVARERGWKLLDCCISAELEAMIDGNDVLTEAISGAGGGFHSRSRSGGDKGRVHDHGEELHMMRSEEDGGRRERSRSVVERSEDEDYDEGPGPELLISHLEWRKDYFPLCKNKKSYTWLHIFALHIFHAHTQDDGVYMYCTLLPTGLACTSAHPHVFSIRR